MNIEKYIIFPNTTVKKPINNVDLLLQLYIIDVRLVITNYFMIYTIKSISES